VVTSFVGAPPEVRRRLFPIRASPVTLHFPGLTLALALLLAAPTLSAGAFHRAALAVVAFAPVYSSPAEESDVWTARTDAGALSLMENESVERVGFVGTESVGA
jgi:hypothetical protein